jgi:hypothetical protein
MILGFSRELFGANPVFNTVLGAQATGSVKKRQVSPASGMRARVTDVNRFAVIS